MTKIRAIRFHRFGGPEVLKVDEIELSRPKPSQMVVRVKAASVNPVDFKIRKGGYPNVGEDRPPYAPGRDVSGVVESCGAQVTKFKPGDEIFGIVGMEGGGYAEKALLDENASARKPSRVDHIHAAAIPLAGQTAWQGLFVHGGLKAGQSVLIQGGSGGVGHFAVQFAKAKGARVLTTVSTANVAFAKSLGADVVIDYKTQRFEDYASDLDMVLDLIAGETRERSWKLLKRGGVLVTTLSEPSQEKAKAFGVRALHYYVQANGAELAEIAGLVDEGRVTPHVEKTYPLEKAADAQAFVAAGHTVGKIVLIVN